MIRITIPHQDSSQVGMAGENEAVHVVRLAFVPVCPAPDARDRRARAVVFGDAHLESKPTGVLVRIKMVNDLKARLLILVINAADIGKHVEGKDGVVTKKT